MSVSPKNKKNKSLIKKISFILLILSLFIGFGLIQSQTVFADTTENENPPATSTQFVPLAPISGIPTAPGTDAIGKITILAIKIFENVKYILVSIAILMIVLIGFRLVTAQGNEEDISKQKTNLIWWIIGLVMVLFAQPFVEMFNVSQGGLFAKQHDTLKERIDILTTSADLAIKYIKYIAGSLAVLFIVRAAYKIIVSGEEETVTTEKKNILGSLVALIAITMSSTYIKNIVYKVKYDNINSKTGIFPIPDAQRGMAELIAVTNLIVTFAGPLAILVLIIGAVLYVSSGGEEDQTNKGKGLIKAAIIGLIIIYGAYGLVVTFISGRLAGTSAT